MERIKVLYIAGYGRSGTTILDNVLGKVDGWFTVGELRYIWDRGIEKNWTCGCGSPFRDCQFWKTVFNKAFGGFDEVNVDLMLRYRSYLPSIKQKSPNLSLNSGKPKNDLSHNHFNENLEKLYRTIRDVTGCEVIVDSSKWASYGEKISLLPSIQMYLIHLVRDPRAVAYSWKRTKKYEPFERSDVYIPKHSSIRTSIEWGIWNMAVEVLRNRIPEKSILLRYEDFGNDPRFAVDKVLDLFGVENQSQQFVGDHQVDLGENHCVSGNPIRFARGDVRIQADMEWETNMSSVDKGVVQILTWPLLLRYGY